MREKKRLERKVMGIGLLRSLVYILPVLLLVLLPASSGTAAAHEMGVSGTHITIDGVRVDPALRGVDDTTALEYAMLAWVHGQIKYAGVNQNFPYPNSKIPTVSLEDFWDAYFAYCQHFNLALARLGASDNWGTGVLYQTWVHQPSAFYHVLEVMSEKAAAHGVFVILVLAGTQDYPAYGFDGNGTVFDPSSTAYSNYITYARDVMTKLASEKGIGIYDLWNEPDSDKVAEKYWKGDKVAFNAWSTKVAEDTSAYAFHPRTMGVAGQGVLFGWGQEDFDLATGKVPFEIADRHYYASSEAPNISAEPEKWANNDGKPLLWSELGNNANHPQSRWTYLEGQIESDGGEAICSMTLIGTAGYPYWGSGVDLFLHALAVPISNDVTPIVYPTVHPIDASISDVIGESWAIVLFFVGIYMIGSGIVNRGRLMMLIPAGMALLALTTIVFVSRV